MWYTLSKALKEYGYNERTGASIISFQLQLLIYSIQLLLLLIVSNMFILCFNITILIDY